MAKGRGGKVGRRQANVPTRERRLLGRVPRLEPGMLARARAMVAGRAPAVRKGKAMSMAAAQDEAERRWGKLATAALGPKIVETTKRRKILTVIAADKEGYLISKFLGDGWTWEEAFENAKG